jgi:hypothetical protein
MAYPFKPLSTEDLGKISSQIKKLILSLRNSKKRFVLSFPKEKARMQNKTSVFDKI